VINDDVRPSQVEGPEPSVPVVNAFGSSQDGAASQQNADKAITQQDIFSQLNSTQQSPVFPFGPVFNQVRQLPGNLTAAKRSARVSSSTQKKWSKPNLNNVEDGPQKNPLFPENEVFEDDEIEEYDNSDVDDSATKFVDDNAAARSVEEVDEILAKLLKDEYRLFRATPQVSSDQPVFSTFNKESPTVGAPLTLLGIEDGVNCSLRAANENTLKDYLFTMPNGVIELMETNIAVALQHYRACDNPNQRFYHILKTFGTKYCSQMKRPQLVLLLSLNVSLRQFAEKNLQ